MIRSLALACLCLGGSSLHGEEAPTHFVRQNPQAALRSDDLEEASGLAASPTRKSFLWLVNDSGNSPALHLVGTNGADRGKVKVRDTDNHDWEDLASFVLDGKPYLLIADTGDNDSDRKHGTLYAVPEPRLPVAGKIDGKVSAAWTIRFRFEDGPRDCEAVAVDEKAGKILLISKRTTPPVVYELPLKPAGNQQLTARRIGKIPAGLPAGVPAIPFGSQPTGLDISADGSMAAVVTYSGVFVFPRADGESWEAAFARPPVALAPHRLRQAESIAFSRDGSLIYAVSEGEKSPVACYRREKAEPLRAQPPLK